MGRSSWDHARSAVRTSGGVLRTVKARQQRSPNDNPRPPARDRIALGAELPKDRSLVEELLADRRLAAEAE